MFQAKVVEKIQTYYFQISGFHRALVNHFY